MKKIAILLALFVSFQTSFAQEKRGFDINKMFFGGSVVLGYGAGNTSTFTIGGNPEIGYSMFKNVDLGICGNYIYTSSSIRNQTTAGTTTEKIRLTLSGLGIFTRLHITDGFFIQLQPEFNTIKYRRFLENPDITLEEGNYPSSSFLVGVGFGSREVGRINFFTTILIDLQKDLYSPYRTFNGEITPIVRSGINFYFGRKNK